MEAAKKSFSRADAEPLPIWHAIGAESPCAAHVQPGRSSL